MNMKVMKFGDTSLRSKAIRKYVYRHVLENNKTSKVIVVISATNRYPDTHATDTPLSMGSGSLTRQGRARLVSTKERLSAPKICSGLLDMGVRTYALPFPDCGILTDKNYDYVGALRLDRIGIRKRLNNYDVLVVGGFTDISPSSRVAALDRGGNDYSAVLFADVLNLKEVGIYTDVNGVYNEGSKLNEYAIKYDKLTCDEMLNMKPRALRDRCTNYAKDHHIRIYSKGTFPTGLGTVVED